MAELSLSVEAKASNKQVTDSVLTKLMQYPESISSYSIEELTKDMDEERVRKWCNIIISLKADGISRNVVKRYYFPLCRSIIESFYHESEMLHEMAHNRSFSSDFMTQTDSVITGRDIISRFTEYQRVCMAMMEIPLENLIVPVYYGANYPLHCSGRISTQHIPRTLSCGHSKTFSKVTCRKRTLNACVWWSTTGGVWRNYY